MVHRAPMQHGRPRATGHPRGFGGILLTQAEWQMFSIGERIAMERPELAVTVELDFTLLSLHMTSGERRKVAASELSGCVRWVRAGMMYAVLCQNIAELRRE